MQQLNRQGPEQPIQRLVTANRLRLQIQQILRPQEENRLLPVDTLPGSATLLNVTPLSLIRDCRLLSSNCVLSLSGGGDCSVLVPKKSFVAFTNIHAFWLTHVQ